MTRDSLFWWFSLIGSILVAISAHFDKFPVIPESWHNGMELGALVYSIISAKMMNSPLPSKSEKRLEENLKKFPYSLDE